jgi:hypothetical protein
VGLPLLIGLETLAAAGSFISQTLPSMLRVTALLATLPFLSGVCEARVGESQAAIEARLLGTDRAAKYTIKAKAKNGESLLEQKQRAFRFKHIFTYLPEGSKPEIAVYYKAVGDQVASLAVMESEGTPPGWEYTIYFHNNISQIEIYKRSQALNQLEINGLLNMNKTPDQRWLKAEDIKDENGEVRKLDSVLGYTHVRSDGAMRCILDGSSIVMFSSKFDENLFDAKKRKELETLPDSLKGF